MDWIFTGDGFEVVDGCFMAVEQGALGAESRLVRVRRLVARLRRPRRRVRRHGALVARSHSFLHRFTDVGLHLVDALPAGSHHNIP